MLANHSLFVVTCFMVVTNAAILKEFQSVSDQHAFQRQAARPHVRIKLRPTTGSQNTSRANLLQKSRGSKTMQASEQVDPVIIVTPNAAHNAPALRRRKLTKSITEVDEAVVRVVPFQWPFNGLFNQTFAHIGSFLVRDANAKVNIDSVSRSDLQAVQDAKHTDDFNVGEMFSMCGDFILWILLACLMVFGGS